MGIWEMINLLQMWLIQKYKLIHFAVKHCSFYIQMIIFGAFALKNCKKWSFFVS